MTIARTRPASQADGSECVTKAMRREQRALAQVIRRLPASAARDVHRGRVAARRLRSMLKTFGALFDRRKARLYRADLRSFARSLASVREADVLAALILGLVPDAESLDPGSAQRIAQALDDAQREARASLARRREGAEWYGLVSALAAHARDPRLMQRADAGVGEVLELIEVSWGKALRLLENKPRTAVQLHRLRLALKHCRYALEPVVDIKPAATERLLRRLRTAQDSIGEHRDAVMALHWVGLNEHRLGRATSGRLRELLEVRERRLRKAAAARSEKVVTAYRRWTSAVGSLRAAAAG